MQIEELDKEDSEGLDEVRRSAHIQLLSQLNQLAHIENSILAQKVRCK